MDRRQRKTREAIFEAFTELIAHKDYMKITVGEIIAAADIGRATFYDHFETKDTLLSEFCEELFCHLFDAEKGNNPEHRHIFNCDSTESPFLHLLKHLQKNDNEILTLLFSQNNSLFIGHFKRNIAALIARNISIFESPKTKNLPKSFWENHIVSTFVETLSWWYCNGMKETPEEITEYFFKVVL